MYSGAVVFRLTQSVKNLVVEAKLQRKRSSSECLNAEVMSTPLRATTAMQAYM